MKISLSLKIRAIGLLDIYEKTGGEGKICPPLSGRGLSDGGTGRGAVIALVTEMTQANEGLSGRPPK